MNHELNKNLQTLQSEIEQAWEKLHIEIGRAHV